MQSHRTQYAHYKLNAEDKMEKCNWLRIASGDEPRPSSSSNCDQSIALRQDWDKRDRELWEFLIESLPLPEWKEKFISVTGGGHVLWQAIVNEFEQETQEDLTKLLSSLYNITQDGCESLSNYHGRLKNLIMRIDDSGENVPQDAQVTCFLQGLNSHYKPDNVIMLQKQVTSLDEALSAVEAAFSTYKELRQQENPAPQGCGEDPSAPSLHSDPQVRCETNHPKPTSPQSTPTAAPTAVVNSSSASSPPSHTSHLGLGSITSIMFRGMGTKREKKHHKEEVSEDLKNNDVVAAAQAHRPAYKVTSLHRGLKNNTGENNCFMNVTIQALWHLGPFRAHLTSFINEHSVHTSRKHVQCPNGDNHVSDLSGGSERIPQGSLLEALCDLFIQYEFTDLTVLPATELRKSVSLLSDHFQLGKHADANEAFDAILQRIHFEQSHHCPEVHKCLAHEVFGGCVMEQTICDVCNATSEPDLRQDFVMYFQAAELLQEAKAIFNKTQVSTQQVKPTQHGHSTMGFSKFLLNLPRFPSFHHHHDSNNNGDLTDAKGVALVTGGVDHGAHIRTEQQPQGKDLHHYSSVHFGRILSNCMTQSRRSCPSILYYQEEKQELERQGQGVNACAGGSCSGGMNQQCNGRAIVHQFSLDPPLAIAISIGWMQDRESAQTLTDFYNLITYSIRLSDIFQIQ
mmetsp:Transcript_95757/g.187994  ORF Transcript_95757/g.187994 Transcript_95757/m.187994 type:complete len:683 (+) Transcript_95757:92-2140(+)